MKKIIIIFTVWIALLALISIMGTAYVNGQNNNGLIEFAKEQVKKLNFEARLMVTLKMKNGNNFIVTDNLGKDYQVFINSSTNLKPKYWGKITLNDFSIGDQLSVIGNWQGNTKIQAVLVRNLSNEIRWGVLLGDIVSKDNNSFTIANRNHGNITVNLGGKIDYLNQADKKINSENLKIGDRVRIKGIFNPKNNKITNVDEIKDFSLR